MKRVLGVLMAATAYFCALAALAHFPLLGPQLAAYAHAQPPVVPMGKTTMIHPGQTVTASDGTQFKIDGGVSTDAPKGFVLDWSGPHGFYECDPPVKTPNGSCQGKIRLHYVNPTTGVRQDAVIKSANEPIPVSVPAREGD